MIAQEAVQFGNRGQIASPPIPLHPRATPERWIRARLASTLQNAMDKAERHEG